MIPVEELCWMRSNIVTLLSRHIMPMQFYILYSIHIYRYLASHKNSEFAKFRRFVKGRVASGTPSSQFDGVLCWKASSAWNSYGGFQCHGCIYGGTPKWIVHKVYNTMENGWNMGEHGWFGDTHGYPPFKIVLGNLHVHVPSWNEWGKKTTEKKNMLFAISRRCDEFVLDRGLQTYSVSYDSTRDTLRKIKCGNGKSPIATFVSRLPFGDTTIYHSSIWFLLRSFEIWKVPDQNTTLRVPHPKLRTLKNFPL